MKTKMFLHGSKDSNYDTAEEIGLSEEATQNFKYALYEVEFLVDVDKKTGDVTIIEAKYGDQLLVPKQK